MRQGSEGEKVSRKRDKMITVENQCLGNWCRGYSSLGLIWQRDSAVIREQHSQNLDTCQERQNTRWEPERTKVCASWNHIHVFCNQRWFMTRKCIISFNWKWMWSTWLVAPVLLLCMSLWTCWLLEQLIVTFNVVNSSQCYEHKWFIKSCGLLRRGVLLLLELTFWFTVCLADNKTMKFPSNHPGNCITVF